MSFSLSCSTQKYFLIFPVKHVSGPTGGAFTFGNPVFLTATHGRPHKQILNPSLTEIAEPNGTIQLNPFSSVFPNS